MVQIDHAAILPPTGATRNATVSTNLSAAERPLNEPHKFLISGLFGFCPNRARQGQGEKVFHVCPHFIKRNGRSALRENPSRLKMPEDQIQEFRFSYGNRFFQNICVTLKNALQIFPLVSLVPQAPVMFRNREQVLNFPRLCLPTSRRCCQKQTPDNPDGLY